jgi:WD40 repeat protein
MRHISLIDWLMFRREVLAGTAFALIKKFPLPGLPYFLLPFVGLLWLNGKRSRAGLFFVAGMSLAGIVNHVTALLVYLYYSVFFWGRFVPPSLRVAIALTLAVIFSLLSYKIFQIGRSLYEKKIEVKDSRGYEIVGAFLALVFCFVSPFVNYGEIVHRITQLSPPIKNVTLLKPGSNIRFMDGSPGGKLLAVGANDGLSVWDAELRQCIWSDDSIAVQRVRFSPSGKYLAAVGRGMPEGASDLAVFEVDGFRRLPGFDWSEEDLRKEKIFHDLVFRPDEKSLLAAWHQEWDWDQMTRDERGTLWGKDLDEIAPGKPRVRDRTLTCTELDFENGNISFSKDLDSLSLVYDLLEHGAIYFSPDASYLLYPKWYDRDNYVARHRVYRVDTNTWKEEEILLDRKYSMLTHVGQSTWYEWKFTRDGKIAYLLVLEVDEGGWNDRAFVLLKMDMETKHTEELRKVPVTRPFERVPWNRIVLSPDEKRIALLGLGETLYDYGGTEKKLTTLRVLDLATNRTKRFVYKHDGQRHSGAWRLLWLSQELLAVSMASRNGFFFVDIK